MRCDDIQATLSARMDGEAVNDTILDRHVARCAECRSFLAGATAVRRELRLSPVVDEIPDVRRAVVDRLAATEPRRPVRRRWSQLVPVAATLVVGMVIGASLFATASRQPVVAEEFSTRVLAAQHVVATFTASVTIEERGWHPAVPVRRFQGTIDYRAPEELTIALADRTRYPDAGWPTNDVQRVVTAASEWSRALPRCPSSQLPGCLPAEPRTTGVADRVPFSGLGRSALEAIVPVNSFRLGGGEDLGSRNTSAGEQLGMSVDVGQVEPLLSAFLGAGNWRELHPADPVELWVDAAGLTPRELVVRAGAGSIREQWAAQRGLDDLPGAPLVRIVITPQQRDPAPPPPTPSGLRSAGFATTPVALPEPDLPDGMSPYRAGTQTTTEHDIATATWSDGRAWVRLRAVRDWRAARLFGDVGSLVRRVTVSDGRTLYIGREGHTIAIHTDDLELVLDGTLSEDDLLTIAASVPVEGRPIPRDWSEVADATLAEAAAALPGLLLPQDLDGFGHPAVQISDDVVTIGYAGSGGRELLVTERRGTSIAPPIVANVVGVEVRGRAGRYLPDSGVLEWAEDGIVVSLRSRDLGVDALIRIAEGMGPAS